MNTDPQVQAFDLPEHCEIDHVVIRESDGTNPYYAVPFIHRDTWDDGTEWLDEPAEFDVTDAYFQAVKERAEMDIDDVQLRRPTAEYSYTAL
jgi:hypothetical protein